MLPILEVLARLWDVPGASPIAVRSIVAAWGALLAVLGRFAALDPFYAARSGRSKALSRRSECFAHAHTVVVARGGLAGGPAPRFSPPPVIGELVRYIHQGNREPDSYGRRVLPGAVQEGLNQHVFGLPTGIVPVRCVLENAACHGVSVKSNTETGCGPACEPV